LPDFVAGPVGLSTIAQKIWAVAMYWFLSILLVCAALIAAGLFARSYMTGTPMTGTLFGPRPDKRLVVLEQASVDSRRRLILIKRDNVEHLIMTGGPVDLVIETGIGASRARPTLAESESSISSPTFARPARTFGHAAGE
jgi:flagellar protein FliO/FliZ